MLLVLLWHRWQNAGVVGKKERSGEGRGKIFKNRLKKPMKINS
jgi:hypothetical protein